MSAFVAVYVLLKLSSLSLPLWRSPNTHKSIHIQMPCGTSLAKADEDLGVVTLTRSVLSALHIITPVLARDNVKRGVCCAAAVEEPQEASEQAPRKRPRRDRKQVCL